MFIQKQSPCCLESNTHFICAAPRANPWFFHCPSLSPCPALCYQHVIGCPRRILRSVGESCGSTFYTPESDCSAPSRLPPAPGTTWNSLAYIVSSPEFILFPAAEFLFKMKIGPRHLLLRNLPALAFLLPLDPAHVGACCSSAPSAPPDRHTAALCFPKLNFALVRTTSSCGPTLYPWQLPFLPGGAVVMSVFVCLLSLGNQQGLPAIRLGLLLSDPSGGLAPSGFQDVWKRSSHLGAIHTLSPLSGIVLASPPPRP